MYYIIKRLFRLIAILIFLTACGKTSPVESVDHLGEADDHAHESEHEHQEEESVHFSQNQFSTLQMAVGKLPRRNIASVVEANGELEVPPQNEAIVTAAIGATVATIKVVEGDDIRKGQVLAYLSHPDLTRMQTEYLEAFNSLQFLEQEYQRQKRLYEEEVGSGKTFQQAQAEFRAAETVVKGRAMQLRQLGLKPDQIQEGTFYQRMPVISPISGTITKVNIKTGQYVQPDRDLFEVVNIEHIHADLMVFEKDIYKIEKDQQVRFQVATLPGEDLFARIYSVGKKFEQDPKALHVHAEIENKTGKLIPGMYIKGQILTDSTTIDALPEAAIIREGDRYLAFLARQEAEDDGEAWVFTPVEVVPGATQDEWVSIRFGQKIPEHAQFALNNAYYLLAEMQKGEAEHSH